MTEHFRSDSGILKEFWRFWLFPLLFHQTSNILISIFSITCNSARTLNFEFWQSYEMMLNQLWGRKLLPKWPLLLQQLRYVFFLGNANFQLFSHSNANCKKSPTDKSLTWWYDDFMIFWKNMLMADLMLQVWHMGRKATSGLQCRELETMLKFIEVTLQERKKKTNRPMEWWNGMTCFFCWCLSGMAKYFQCTICGCQEAGGKSWSPWVRRSPHLL